MLGEEAAISVLKRYIGDINKDVFELLISEYGVFFEDYLEDLTIFYIKFGIVGGNTLKSDEEVANSMDISIVEVDKAVVRVYAKLIYIFQQLFVDNKKLCKKV